MCPPTIGIIGLQAYNIYKGTDRDMQGSTDKIVYIYNIDDESYMYRNELRPFRYCSVSTSAQWFLIEPQKVPKYT